VSDPVEPLIAAQAGIRKEPGSRLSRGRAGKGDSVARDTGPGDASTVAAVRRKLAEAFAGAGLDTPALDARVLVQHALGASHAELAGFARRTLTADEAERIAAMAARRLAREPVAYVVGEKEFWGLPLSVGPAVLIPRPDTETLVEAALAACRREQALRIVDLGVGSGAILLALLSELPQATALGIDISPAAVAVARANAARLGLAGRAAFAVGDFTAPLGAGVDLLVSNPPYVTTSEIDALPADVRAHEPRAALDGGADGLAFYRRLAGKAGRVLAGAGSVAVEIGAGQGDAVAALFAGRGFVPAAPAKPDLAGVPRALLFRRG
jgi:release factor glutamine methyltransferase